MDYVAQKAGSRFQWLLALAFLAAMKTSSLPVTFAEEPAAAIPSAQAPANVEVVADKVIRLAYKFRPGQFLHYSGSSRVQYLTQLQDKSFTTLQQNETGTHFRVVTVDDQGNALIEPVVDRTRMTAKMPGKDPVVYDSESTEPVSLEFRHIHEAIGRPVARFQVAPHGELLKATIVDPTAPQSLRDSAEKLTTRFAFLSRLPQTPIKVGDKWKEDYSTMVSVGTGLKQPVPIRRMYELASVTDGIALIKFKTVILRSLNDPDMEKQVVQQTPQGSVEFDIEQGLVRTHTSAINQTIINAFGSQSLLQAVGEATEKLVPRSAEGGQKAAQR